MVKLRERAYEQFTQNLLQSRIRPGQFVSQRELVELMKMPLGAIRELIPRLEADGLIETVPQRGMQIASVDLKMVRNAFQLRMILEKVAAQHFIEVASDEEIERLAAAHKAIDKRAKEKIDQKLLSDAQAVDWRLHDAFIDSLGNEIISSVYRVNSIRIRLIRLDRVLLTPHSLVPAMREHMVIIEALRSRDAKKLDEALDTHLDSARRRAMGV
jgi:DNA-binding GntR family transcriptional regulator